MVTVDYQVTEGNLFDFDADAIVNPWNRNFVPRVFLIPMGVSRQLKQLKHRACDGSGWDFDTDQPIPCNCPCHTTAKS